MNKWTRKNTLIWSGLSCHLPETMLGLYRLCSRKMLYSMTVSKSKAPKQEQEEAGVPQNWFPLFNPEKSIVQTQQGILQFLENPFAKEFGHCGDLKVLADYDVRTDFFYLEKWRQRMILELGEDGFAEYTSSNLLDPDAYSYYVSQSRKAPHS